MNKYRYAREKFRRAVCALVGLGTAAERLNYAYMYLNHLGPKKVPTEIRRKLEKFRRNMVKKGPSLESANAMSEPQLITMTRSVVDMFETVVVRQQEEPHSPSRRSKPGNGKNGRRQ